MEAQSDVQDLHNKLIYYLELILPPHFPHPITMVETASESPEKKLVYLMNTNTAGSSGRDTAAEVACIKYPCIRLGLNSSYFSTELEYDHYNFQGKQFLITSSAEIPSHQLSYHAKKRDRDNQISGVGTSSCLPHLNHISSCTCTRTSQSRNYLSISLLHKHR